MTKALVVLSGGQDSTTTLFIAKQKYDTVDALTLDYDQRHATEIDAAKTVALLADVRCHEVLHLGPILHGSSPLTNSEEDLETYDSYEEMERTIGSRVELTFVPARNLLFLTLAVNRAVVAGINDIYTGVCQADNSNYPDCRLAFIESLQSTARWALGQEKGGGNRIEIHTPLMYLTKAQSIELALTLPHCYTALGFSHTAYSGEYPPVTKDHATTLRAQGFVEAGVPDPLIVRAYWDGLCNLPATVNYERFEKDINHLTNDSIIDRLNLLEEYCRIFKSTTGETSVGFRQDGC